MRLSIVICFWLLTSGVSVAQEQMFSRATSQDLAKGTWEVGLLGGAGNGIGSASNTRFVYFGGRIGRVLTRDHLSGWFRGNFEWAADLLPVYPVVTAGRIVYGGSLKPVIWKWNFTRSQNYVPYVAAAGGILFSDRNVPPGNTSWVNFSPQVSVGTLVWRRSGGALFLESSLVHHSNARLGTQNPGYNASLFLTIGYDWIGHSRRRGR